MRPFELVGVALIVGIFIGLVVLMSTRDLTVSAVWLGVSFIAMLVISATVVLMIKPRKDELADIEELDATPKTKAPGATKKK
jgi:bacteriorhodopsin